MAAISFLKNWFSPQFSAKLLPDYRFGVVGDVHGRADLLVDLLERLTEREGCDLPLVFVGDYVDRGEESAEVIKIMLDLQTEIWPGKVTCLKGNHEDMLLAFLDAPEKTGTAWLRNGGKQTLSSFGVALPDGSAEGFRIARTALRDALGFPAEIWLRKLPSSYRSGNVFVSHAGANPNKPVENQSEDHLVWGHRDFLQTPRTDGIWVAHGHHIHKEPIFDQGRIAVDTGGYATNRLTAAIIDHGTCSFIATTDVARS
ncbi:MAG: serine/threonine protein phosphatase [Rhodobacteraceae bacterium]|nr:MAG: serine/threonine protein phosphatase [Paracoccaceae bacterium]